MVRGPLQLQDLVVVALKRVQPVLEVAHVPQCDCLCWFKCTLSAEPVAKTCSFLGLKDTQLISWSCASTEKFGLFSD